MVRQQIEAVFAELPPAAVKTGMLFSAPIIRVVTDFFRRGKPQPLIVDPVMVSTSGSQLLQPAAMKALLDLLPLALLVTPNLDEARILTDLAIRSEEDMRPAARVLHQRFGCAALVKGGHLRGTREAVDIFYDGQTELMLSAPFIRRVSTHGTGCTYSAAITGYRALGHDLARSVVMAKQYVSQAISDSQRVAKHSVLGSVRRQPEQV